THPVWLERVPWINIDSGTFHFRVDYALGTDGLGLPLIILNGLLTFLSIVFSWHEQKRPKLYFALLLFLETGVMGVFSAFDLFLFFLFWEVELIPMFLLIGIWGGARREYAAWKFLIYTLVGSAFTLAGIFLLYFKAGQVSGTYSASYENLAAAATRITGTLPFFGTSVPLALITFLLLFAGFAVKIPM
ncbi:MAG: NADH-quinone oxidoreductase subunit M, partial [Ktedonobacterales bacterium]|nr:NADH-quinone oxidoreductase subunit M [Ktedonobacterales bacterium]